MSVCWGLETSAHAARMKPRVRPPFHSRARVPPRRLGEHSETRCACCVLDPRDPLLHSERTQGFAADPVYGRAKCLPMLGAFKT